MKIEEQDRVLENKKKMMLVSASAGSGKTHVMMQYITKLVCVDNLPVKDFLVLTFTKAAAAQMKERLVKNLKENQQERRARGEDDTFVVEQLDEISTANISTIHSFCEKSIKKYANLLNLNESFSVMDEQMSLILRDDAFERAYKRFEEENEDEFFELADAFKHEKKKICEIIKEIESLANSVADKRAFLSSNLQEAEKYFDDAIAFLFTNTKEVVQDFVLEVEKLKLGSFEDKVKSVLEPIVQSTDIFKLTTAIDSFKFPRRPSQNKIGNEAFEKIGKIKDKLCSALSKISALNLNDKESVEYQRSGALEKMLIHLYEIYEEEECALKATQNCLDFYDLEKYMDILSQKENLFDGLKYVFVDEYQDTNKIQEKIVKNVAKNCNFVAVGDAKQGIYGFRLASAEIFLKDLQDFQQGEDSAVNFLQCNFRTTQKVLDFVNNIFKVCMTKELTGIEYYPNSMLVQAKQERFVDDGKKAVNIDIIAEKEEAVPDKPKIYSVKEAEIFKEDKYELLKKDIKRRLVEVLNSQIPEEGVLRKVNFGDIAILSRGRNTLFNELEVYLQENGIPVVSNSREKLLDQPEMKMLLSILKLALVFDDDVALLSVLLSGLYCMNIEDILQAKADGESLCETVKENLIFSDFMRDLQAFKNTYPVFGLRKALVDLFAKKKYRAFINLHHPNLNVFVEKFLDEVERFDFDLPNAINYFETVDVTVTAEASVADDAVLLTTIHDSKGLEYPIVFLINCGKDLFKSRPKSEVEINEKFGLAVKMYDQENNSESTGARMLAIKQSQRAKSFVEELMIFYVALTRAKNRLYLFGLEDDFSSLSLKHCSSYFDFIFYALEKERKAFLQEKYFESENLEINFVEDVKEEEFGVKQDLQNAESDAEIVKKIEKYLNFSYKFSENQNFRLKESVTSLNNKNAEDVLQKFNTDSFNFSSNAIDMGNAYHLALKSIDFDKVETLQELEKEIQKNSEFFDVSLIDKEILFKNILLLKQFTNGGKVYKEKEFIMKEKISNILQSDVSDEILVQGIVDLFIIKNEEVILIDYKFTNSINENYLINKYKNQLKTYKIAVENAFNLKIKEIYLLSLKYGKLIPVEL